MNEMKFPTEMIELPSKGLVYPESNPLFSGKIEMKYMTAKEEDILTNQNFIKQGIVLDKLLQSLIVTKINYDDLIFGDKEALLVAARILGYGKDYNFRYKGKDVTVDLSKLENKNLPEEALTEKGKNEFKFKLPKTGTELTFKLLTVGDEKKIIQELEGLKKLNQNPELTTRLKHIIVAVEGQKDPKIVREFVDGGSLLAVDSKEFRDYIRKIQPKVDLTFKYENEDNQEELVEIPIGVGFFWPEFQS